MTNPTDPTWAFIDEYGDPNIATEKDGVSKYFIVTAVVVRGEQLAELSPAVDAIRAKFFQTGEMKSTKVASDRSRWVRLLGAVGGLSFRFYGLAVDKTSIDRSSGLKWKQSFYKNVCGRAYGKLMQAYPNLHVRADQHGRTEFMESFAAYIRENHRPTLFDRGTFEFVDGKKEVLVQLADIVAGLLARVYDPGKLLARPEELPVRYRVRSDPGDLPTSGSPDERIARHSIALAETFIAKHEAAADDDARARVAVLERLLFERRFGDSAKPVATGALLDNLRDRGLAAPGETWLRRTVIAPLRDRGLLITSSQQGYKLPDRRADLVVFARHAESVCVPMINRVNAACDIVKLATGGEVDVLSEPQLAVLRKLVTSLDEEVEVPDPLEP
jgi:hypothetical protein